MANRAYGVTALFLAMTLVGGCTRYWTPRVAERPVAEKGVSLFHERLNDQQFDEIYKSIERRGRGATEMIAFIRQVRDQYGSFVSSEQKVAMCAPSAMTLVYHTRYSKGDTTELFAWRIYGGDAYLLKYQVSPGFEENPGDLPYICPEQENP